MILIDISLPDNCLECPLHNEEYGYCNVDRNFDIGIFERPRSCPIIEERKKGKWIPHREKSREYIGTTLIHVTYDYWLCDTCGYRVENGRPMYNFCPNCGADMRGEQDGRSL